MPTGTVTFYDGTTSLGTGTLSSGTATYSATSLAVGTHSITASYGGDASNSSSTSSAITITITAATAPDFTLAVSGTSAQTVKPGQSASYSINVSPLNGSYPGTVTFAASGLPVGATASFSPSSIASTSGAQAVTLTIQTSAASARERAPCTVRRSRAEAHHLGSFPSAIAWGRRDAKAERQACPNLLSRLVDLEWHRVQRNIDGLRLRKTSGEEL